MSESTRVVLDEKGRIVVPSSIRERRHWNQDTVLVLVETADGLLLTERETALQMVRNKLAGRSLVDELTAERRAEARADDDAS